MIFDIDSLLNTNFCKSIWLMEEATDEQYVSYGLR